MIEIIYKDNKFLLKGTFEFGFIGTYENKEFTNDGKIGIGIFHDLENILEAIKNKETSSDYYQIVKDYIIDDKIDIDTISKAFAEYYNKMEIKIKENEKLIKSDVLLKMFYFFNDVGYKFWKIKELLIKDEFEKVIKENLGDKKYKQSEICDLIYKDANIISEWTMKDVKAGKLDVEKSLKQLFPMFNFEALFNSSIPTYLGFNGKHISFEFCNKFKNDKFYPYDKIDEDFNFLDWHFDCRGRFYSR